MAKVWMSRERASRTCVAARADVVGNEYDGQASAELVKDVAVITIRGPLELHANAEWASYEELHAALEACAGADAIVLDIDSPGGVTDGMVEACRRMRSLALPPVYAVANTMACSAAYALACVADAIYCPASGEVGSVGVYRELCSLAGQFDRDGMHLAVVASGARKAEYHPANPITPELVARAQSEVDDAASGFFAWVQERRGIDARGFEGAAFGGVAAEGLGLSDGVATLAEVLDILTGSDAGESGG